MRLRRWQATREEQGRGGTIKVAEGLVATMGHWLQLSVVPLRGYGEHTLGSSA